MRYTPDKICKEYYEWPHKWEVHPWFSEPPKKRKKNIPTPQWLKEGDFNIIENKRIEYRQFTICYWRDIDKPNEDIKAADIHFEKWPRYRCKPVEQVYLPPDKSNGLRFIKLTKAFPLGWHMETSPMNIAEVREMIKTDAENRKKAREAAKAAAAAKAEKERLAKLLAERNKRRGLPINK